MADRIFWRARGVSRPRPDYEARLAERRTLRLVRPLPAAFDWEAEVPELRTRVRVVERVVDERTGRAFYVARTVEL